MNTKTTRHWTGLAFIICVLATKTDATAQRTSHVALSARYGWASTHGPDRATGGGFELEVAFSRSFVATVRLDDWNFGFACVGIGPCANGFTTLAAGGKYRFHGGAPLTPYLGADVGYTEWTSDVTGPSVRVRAGADITLVRHVDLSLDATQMQFIDRSDGARLPQKKLFGISGGLRVWI